MKLADPALMRIRLNIVRLHLKGVISVVMYPLHYYSLIPPFPRTKRVFVAISFDPRFDRRWTNVLAPAIASLESEKQQLEPYRVDLSKASDAILTEILAGIGDSHCVVADITALDEFEGRPLRNPNVLYEVGIAHAVRPPEEVIIFRSDDLHLNFDVAGVRVHSYSPDSNVGEARSKVTEIIVASLAALDARRRATLRIAGERLTLPAMFLLLDVFSKGSVVHPQAKTIGQALSSIERASAISLLLELGAIRTKFIQVTPELLQEKGDDLNIPLLTYEPTPLGKALMTHVGTETGVLGQDMKVHFERIIAESEGAV